MIEGNMLHELPSYSTENRGELQTVIAILSEKSPLLLLSFTESYLCCSDEPSISCVKFENMLQKDSLLMINSSLVNQKPSKEDVKAYYIPANEMAKR